ncbi:MAG: anthranilate phosphoribosyltransferase, partial [Spirochaetes bacterium]
EELAGLASVLDRNKTKIGSIKGLVDTCGTGGDGKGSFNISSLAAIVASSCGARVAKHGNRSISSKSGSADFYRALGIPVEINPKSAEKLLKKTGFTFLFAPIYHKSMKYAAQVRRELGIKTVMNILGPLVNPADADYQTIGVYDESLLETVAEAAILLGKSHVLTFHSEDGLDEISVCAPTNIVEIYANGEKKKYKIQPEDFGIGSFSPDKIKGGTANENAKIALAVLKSDTSEFSAIRDAVTLNTGAALYVSKTANTFNEGVNMARDAIESGKAFRKLEEIIEYGKSILEGN